MRYYRAFYKGRTYDLDAPSSYEAQCLAAKYFKAKKAYEVAVVLLDVPVDVCTL
jgi:hypothetical protein